MRSSIDAHRRSNFFWAGRAALAVGVAGPFCGTRLMGGLLSVPGAVFFSVAGGGVNCNVASGGADCAAVSSRGGATALSCGGPAAFWFCSTAFWLCDAGLSRGGAAGLALCGFGVLLIPAAEPP